MQEDVKLSFTCNFTMSRNIEGLNENIKEVAEKTLEAFKKTWKDDLEKVKIEILSLNGNILTVNFTSNLKIRPTSLALRFRKILAEDFGLKFKIGLRKVEASTIVFQIPVKEFSKEALEKIKSLTYVDEVKLEDKELHVKLKPMSESELKRNVPDRVFNLIRETLEKLEKPKQAAIEIPIVKQSPPKKVKFWEDPAKACLEYGWIKEFPGRGQWIYTTPYAKLLESIESILLDEVVHKLDFQPFMLPKLIPLDVMRRMPGYLEEIPEGMYYVCPPPRDPEAFEEFKEAVKLTKTVPRDMLKRIIKDPEYVLAPAQCEPFWQFFSHETLRVEDLPFKLYDRSGWTYRWEGGGVEGLARLQEFRRIELVYLGTPKQVVEIRDSIVDEVVRVVDKILELEWRVVAATPFYMKEGEIGDISRSENVAAFDVEVYLPYRGERDKAEWLEIAGCFIHKDKFVKSFSIHEAKNREIWTGCTGLGISRWITAFLSTHGLNVEDWPLEVKRRFGEYKLPKTLLWPKKF